MNARIERMALPDLVQVRKALGARADAVVQGASLVDGDAQGPTGVDLVLADEEGRPVFVDVAVGDANSVPTRVFEHLGWFEQNRRLFLRAYANDGVVRTEDPIFVFVSSRFSASVLAAVAAMPSVPVRLVRMEYYLVDGAPEILLEDVTPVPQREVGTPIARREVSTPVTRRADDISDSADRGPEKRIESDAVRTLLTLFRSGVDGLDGGIKVSESGEGMSFRFGERVLAEVAASPGSFTVSLGDRAVNPIVVSDRVSLERALNAVVSLFVREEVSDTSERRESGPELTEEQEAELASIWSSGVGKGEGS